MELDVIVLAAGQGKRFVSDVPKILQSIGNLPIIQHVLMSAYELNPANIIIVLDKSFNIPNLKLEGKKQPIIVFQTEKFGTADAVEKALPYIKSPHTLILYGDTPLISYTTLLKIINVLSNKAAEVVVLGFENHNVNNQYGRLVLKENLIQKVIEFTELDVNTVNITLCNSGVIALSTEFLLQNIKKIINSNIQKERYLTDLVKIACDLGARVQCVKGDYSEGMGVNCREDLVKAEHFFQERLRKKFLHLGVSFIDPSTVYLSYDTVIEKDALIQPHNVIKPGVTIKSKATILPFCLIEKSHIGEGTVIGPSCNLLSTNIGEDSYIGSCVEIKRSQIGNQVKIKHFSYIGDSEIGDGTNIGAGTITCNFDGKNKHQTFIGKDCLIGANNTLVAPISIGERVKTGAGSTLTQAVENDTLAIARARQVNLVSHRKK